MAEADTFPSVRNAADFRAEGLNANRIDSNINFGQPFRELTKETYPDLNWFLYDASDQDVIDMGYTPDERHKWVSYVDREDHAPDGFKGIDDMNAQVGEDAKVYRETKTSQAPLPPGTDTKL